MENAEDCRRWRAGPHGNVTKAAMVGRVVCLAVVVTQAGCRSEYRFHCTSRPWPAGVLVGEEMLGETPCDVTIPRDSEWIQDEKVEMRFCLPDGREKTHVVDLSSLKASNPLAEIVSAPLIVTGIGLVLLCGGDDEDEEDEDVHSWMSRCEKKEDHGDRGMQFVGFGVAAVGVGVFHLLGGDSDSLTPYDVYVRFEEPVGEPADEQGGPWHRAFDRPCGPAALGWVGTRITPEGGGATWQDRLTVVSHRRSLA